MKVPAVKIKDSVLSATEKLYGVTEAMAHMVGKCYTTFLPYNGGILVDGMWDFSLEDIEYVEVEVRVDPKSCRTTCETWVLLNAALPNPEEYPRVLIYTKNDTFDGKQYFDVDANHLNEEFFADPSLQPKECKAATHWTALPFKM